MTTKNKFLQIRIAEETNQQLKHLAVFFGLSDKSEVVRFLIVNSYRKNILTKKPIKKSK